MMRVISIVGWGRSGSTLLDRMLGSAPGALSTGELRYLYERGIAERGTCGCGEPVLECALWSSVLDRTRESATDPESTIHLLNRFARTRHTRALLRTDPQRAQRTAGLGELVRRLEKLYAAIAEVAECDLIVDSSKWPSHGALLRLVPDIDLFVVHLVRDPRAVAYSWSRPKAGPDRDIPRCGTVFSSAKWLQWNLACDALERAVGRERSLTVRYEDLVAAPDVTIERILSLAGHRGARPAASAGSMVLPKAHTISGNPDRFVTGTVTIREDARWLRALPAYRWGLATAITAPGLGRYRYGIGEGAPWTRTRTDADSAAVTPVSTI